MKVIVITGSIASGKSEVSRLLRKLGALVIDADEVVHGILERGERTKKHLLEEFGPGIFEEGRVDRDHLGKIVFAQKEKRVALEKLLHPQVKRIISGKIKRLEKQGIDVIFLEIPLFFEVRWPHSPDEIWVVYSSPDLQRKRLKEKGFPESEIEKRISAQLPWEAKLTRATRIIDNSGSLRELEEKVLSAYNSLFER